MKTETALHITGILLGGFLSMIFIGYMILSFKEGKKRQGPSPAQKFAGVFSLLLGILMACAWAYLLDVGWFSFRAQGSELLFHVLTEFATSVLLIIAGNGLLRNWARGPALILIANGLLVFTNILALFSFGAKGHSFLMNGITILLTIASAYFVGLVYGWQHFALRMNNASDA